MAPSQGVGGGKGKNYTKGRVMPAKCRMGNTVVGNEGRRWGTRVHREEVRTMGQEEAIRAGNDRVGNTVVVGGGRLGAWGIMEGGGGPMNRE